MRAYLAILASIGLFACVTMPGSTAAADCSGLTSATLPNAKILAATTLSGSVTGPDGKVYSNLPPFCSVSILAMPSPDSAINILLWMPETWNGRFEGTGNGGYAGSMGIDGPAMVYAVSNGWAVASNDMGTDRKSVV